MGHAVIAGAFACISSFCVLTVVACSPPAPAVEPSAAGSAAAEAEPGAAEPREPGARLVCRALGPHERTRALSAQARAELEASRDGEHYLSARFEPAMARLREAAYGGERIAQGVYGKTRVTTLFQYDAPRPEQREVYVEALAFWRTAALAELEPDSIGIAAATPDGLASPLSELPVEWVREAWARADRWIRCHGLPW